MVPLSLARIRASPMSTPSAPMERTADMSSGPMDAALRHIQHPGRNLVPQPGGVVQIHGEVLQIPIVHPDDPGPGRTRRGNLLGIVGFYQGGQAQILAGRLDTSPGFRIQQGADEEHAVRPHESRLVELVGVHREVLAEAWGCPPPPESPEKIWSEPRNHLGSVRQEMASAPARS